MYVTDSSTNRKITFKMYVMHRGTNRKSTLTCNVYVIGSGTDRRSTLYLYLIAIPIGGAHFMCI